MSRSELWGTVLVGGMALTGPGVAFAQVQFDLSPAFTGDYVHNTGDTTEDSMDSISTVLVTEAVAGAGKGLPDDGIFSATADHPRVELAAVDTDDGDNGILLFSTETASVAIPAARYERVQIYTLSTQGTSSADVELTYSDGTSASQTLNVVDWFDDPPPPGAFYLIDGMDRWSIPSGTIEVRNDPAVFGFDLNVDDAKELVRVDVTNDTVGSTRLVVLGMTGETLGVRANDDAFEVDEDDVLVVDAVSGVLANDFEPEGLPLTAAIARPPTRGSVQLQSDGSFTYTPNPDFFGADDFGYTASNGTTVSAPAEVTIDVLNVNDPPFARDDTYGVVSAGAFRSLEVLVNDEDGPNEDGALRVVATTVPDQGGTAAPSGGQRRIEYVAPTGFEGEERFQYTIEDTGGATATATVTVRVGLPTANPDAYATSEDQELSIPASRGVLANDVEPAGGTLTAELVEMPTSGTVDLSADGAFTYRPSRDFFGTDGFTYFAETEDGAATPAASVTLTVEPVNDPPTANDDAVTVTAGELVVVEVLANDTADPDDLETLSVTSVFTGSLGGVTEVVNGGRAVSYRPRAATEGEERIRYVIDDGDSESTDSAEIVATVLPASTPDAGPVPDAGPTPDAGVTDAGGNGGGLAEEGGGCRGVPSAGAYLPLALVFIALALGRRRRR